MTFAQPFKDYEILERVGSGAMGTVFKARQKRLNRIVALKVLKPMLARNTKFVERLRREARIVASLNHPDIVAGYDIGEEGGYHFFVMEFVEGKSLATLLKEWGAFPEEQVLDVATRVASALDHAFKKGVIHRDVKPGNILIDPDGRAKLTDMGLAKASEDVTITQEGATVGTPQYISPEQARDPSKADVRSDLYSLGATMFHMCTGQPPFVGATLANLIHEVIHQRAPSAAAVNPAVSDGLGLVIKKLLAKDPALRYQTPAELLADLHRVRRAERPQVDEGVLAAEDAVVANKTSARPRVLLWAAVGLLACAGAGYALWPRTAANTPSSPPPTFMTWVQANVSAAQGWRGKLRALVQAAAEATTDDERRAVADLRIGMLIPWQDAIEQFVRERRSDAARYVLEPEHWRDPARELRKGTVEALERKFAISRAELPADLGRVLDTELDRLDAEVAAKSLERDQNLLAAYRAHWEGDVAVEWRTALEQSDYAAAERAVRGGGDVFFGQAGRPRREQLGAALKEFAAVEERGANEALRQIEQTQARAAADIEHAATETLGEMRQNLRDAIDPYVLQRRFEAWRREFIDRYPGSEAFRTGHDPWPRVAGMEAGFTAALSTAREAADQRRLLADAQLALGALLSDGDATQELRWLRERGIEDAAVSALRERWGRLFDEAHVARDWLLEALASKQGGRTLTVSDPSTIGRSLQVSVRRENGLAELVERDGARARRVSLAALRVSELIEQVPAPSGAPAMTSAIDRGLALWLYCAGETSLAGKRLPAQDAAFFGEHVARAVQAALGQRRGDETHAREALARLRSTYRDLAPVDLRAALDGFNDQFGQTAVALASVQVLQDLRAHLRAGEQNASLLTGLRAAVSSSLQVAVLADGGARVVCEPAQAQGLPLGSGWAHDDKTLRFAVADVALEATRTHALVVQDNLSTEHSALCTGLLEFAAQGGKPRLYLLEVHGVGIALGLTAAGEPFAAIVSVDDLVRDKVLQRELERQIDALVEPRSPSPIVVVGARHTVAIGVRVQNERLLARVSFDGVEIVTGNVKRAPKTVARVCVMPMQPLAVWRLAVEGQP